MRQIYDLIILTWLKNTSLMILYFSIIVHILLTVISCVNSHNIFSECHRLGILFSVSFIFPKYKVSAAQESAKCNCSLVMLYKNLNVLFTVPSATVRRCNQQKETMKQEFVLLQSHSLSPRSFFFFYSPYFPVFF